MSQFCVVRLAPDARLRPEHGVLSAAVLELTAQAQLLARQIVQQAEAEREALLAEARAQAQLAVRESEARVLQEGEQLLQGLRQAMQDLLGGAEDIVTGLARQLYERLVFETTPAERIAAAYRRVLEEAPPKLVNAVLRLHPADMPLLAEVAWDCKADARLAPGTCRLEADSGEWQADFSAAVAALTLAFGAATTAAATAATPDRA